MKNYTDPAIIRDSADAAVSLLPQLADQFLPRLGAWCLRTIEALPEKYADCAGWRDLYFDLETGKPKWHWQRSNAAERIGVFLRLAEYLKDERYLDAAVHYGEAFLDGVYGQYRGPEAEGRGQVWYWHDCGTYMTNYTMRVPTYLLELAKVTHRQDFEECAVLAGEALLRAQRPNGILKEGFIPPEIAPCENPWDPDTKGDWVTNYKIESRVGFAVCAFAEMYRHTGDRRYAEAFQKLTDALDRYQHEDGSFPQVFALEHTNVLNDVVKGHLQGYILNGTSKALLYEQENAKLRKVAVKLADYVVHTVRTAWTFPYGNPFGDEVQEAHHWRSGGADTSPGLIWMYRATGNPVYRETAARLLVNACFSSLNMPEKPDFHGAIPLWENFHRKCNPSLDGYYHFHSVLGLLEALKTLE